MLADLLRQAPAPEGRPNETQVVERKKVDQEPSIPSREGLSQLITNTFNMPPPFSADEEDYTDSDESHESSEPPEPEPPELPVAVMTGVVVYWNSRRVNFDFLQEQRAAATGIGYRNIHRDMSWGWGLDGYLGMLDDEDFSREDLENSEQVEAGVWVDWEQRVVRVHSAVRVAIESASRRDNSGFRGTQDERIAATLRSLR